MTPHDAELLARGLLEDQERRWAHVCGVAKCAEDLGLPELVVTAAWLHDIGYSPEVKDTGMHAIDGARFLQDRGWPADVVSLIAHHTGAWSEAESRGLSDQFEVFAAPPEDLLDALTLCDLLVAPNGTRTTPDARIEEILQRYEPRHPVHEAVNRSAGELMARARRGRSRLSTDVRAVTPLEGMA